MSDVSTVEFGFRRSFGRHDFTTSGGKSITVISEPTWEEFWETTSSATDLGQIVVSPELMTSPVQLDQVDASQRLIERRVAQVSELSRSRAGTTFALGSATFKNRSGRPANSVLFIKDGELIGQTNKAWSLSILEKKYFTLRPYSRSARLASKIVSLVCSDIIGERYASQPPVKDQNPVIGYREALLIGSDYHCPDKKVKAQTETVLLSSCWAVPLSKLFETDPPAIKDARYRRQLEISLASLFRMRPALLDVIIADRSIGDSSEQLPFIGQFRRGFGPGSQAADN